MNREFQRMQAGGYHGFSHGHKFTRRSLREGLIDPGKKESPPPPPPKVKPPKALPTVEIVTWREGDNVVCAFVTTDEGTKTEYYPAYSASKRIAKLASDYTEAGFSVSLKDGATS